MKNLNELGVQEMDVKEMKKTDGGESLAYYFGYFIGTLRNQLDKEVLVEHSRLR